MSASAVSKASHSICACAINKRSDGSPRSGGAAQHGPAALRRRAGLRRRQPAHLPPRLAEHGPTRAQRPPERCRPCPDRHDVSARSSGVQRGLQRRHLRRRCARACVSNATRPPPRSRPGRGPDPLRAPNPVRAGLPNRGAGGGCPARRDSGHRSRRGWPPRALGGVAPGRPPAGRRLRRSGVPRALALDRHRRQPLQSGLRLRAHLGGSRGERPGPARPNRHHPGAMAMGHARRR